MNKKILFLIFFAFLIRLIAINQSLWLDEATTAKVVQTYNFSQIASQFSIRDFHPPLYYWVIKLWTNIFGYSEISLRFPSIIFSLLTGWVVFLIGKKLKNISVGFWACVFFLFNPLIMYYSQEARMYMFVTFLLTSAIYFVFDVVTGQCPVTTKNCFLFILCLILSFLTFYGSIFLIVPMFIYLLLKKKYKVFIFSSIALLLTIFLLSPLLIQQLINSHQSLSQVSNWTGVLGKVNLKNLLLIPIKFSIGRINFEPKIVYYLISGLWSIIVFGYVIKGGQKNRLLFYLSLGTLFLGILFSYWSPLLQYFRFLYLIPIISILIAYNNVIPANEVQAGIHLYRFRVKPGMTNWFIFTGFLLFSLIYLLNPSFHREDWKQLSSDLKSKKIYAIFSSMDALRYYRPDIKISDLRSVDTVREDTLVVITYTTNIYGLDYKTRLNYLNYYFVKKNSYRGIELEYWSH